MASFLRQLYLTKHFCSVTCRKPLSNVCQGPRQGNGCTNKLSTVRGLILTGHHTREYGSFCNHSKITQPIASSLHHSVSQSWRMMHKKKLYGNQLAISFNPCLLDARFVSQGKHPIPKIPPTKIMRHYDIHGSISDDDSAKQFVFALSSRERNLLLTELEKYRDVEERLGNATKPSSQQLKQVFLHQALPFIGFGFLDNLLMIVAGEYIDATLGAFLGISTMAAAALGNLFSDIGGIGSASTVESIVSKFGVRAPQLTPEQVDMGSTKWASNMGKVIGVTIGCLIGMFPLLLFSRDKAEDCDASKAES